MGSVYRRKQAPRSNRKRRQQNRAVQKGMSVDLRVGDSRSSAQRVHLFWGVSSQRESLISPPLFAALRAVVTHSSHVSIERSSAKQLRYESRRESSWKCKTGDKNSARNLSLRIHKASDQLLELMLQLRRCCDVITHAEWANEMSALSVTLSWVSVTGIHAQFSRGQPTFRTARVLKDFLYTCTQQYFLRFYIKN